MIVGLAPKDGKEISKIFSGDVVREVESISPYLTAGAQIYVSARQAPLSQLSEMLLWNFAKDGGNLLLSVADARSLDERAKPFLRPIYGAQEFIQGIPRFCLWIADHEVDTATQSEAVRVRLSKVAEARAQSPKEATAAWANHPHRFVEIRSPAYSNAIIVPRVSSEERPFLVIAQSPGVTRQLEWGCRRA